MQRVATPPSIPATPSTPHERPRSSDGALQRIADRLACPDCRTTLERRASAFACASCAATFGISDDGVVDLRPPALQDRGEVAAWTKHWSDDNQASASQRFFSVYRKAIFARTVEYFVDTYFPVSGVFLEAGSGTSETSMRVDKRDARTLVAVDLILPVLARCHPVMDVRMGADIFNLPFRSDSVDGIWNVGVMEHFTQDQIDQILREFRRVLRPGGRIILLWPGTDSVPQRVLRVGEWIINRRSTQQEKFRFHPDEISQLPSVAKGRAILSRNGFETVAADPGPRSLFAFKIMVGAKPAVTAEHLARTSAGTSHAGNGNNASRTQGA